MTIRDIIMRLLPSNLIPPARRLYNRTQLSLIRMKNCLAGSSIYRGVCFNSKISPDAFIHCTAHVDLRGVIIERGAVVGPGAVVCAGVRVEQDAIIGPNSVIGSEGFVCRRLGERAVSIRHSGRVVIRRNTFIGSNSCVDRATNRQATVVGANSSVGEFTHIAHNVTIGDLCTIESGVMIAGHVELGANVYVAAGSSISDNLEIGERARIGPGSVVTKTVFPGARIAGNFAIEESKHRGAVESIIHEGS